MSKRTRRKRAKRSSECAISVNSARNTMETNGSRQDAGKAELVVVIKVRGWKKSGGKKEGEQTDGVKASCDRDVRIVGCGQADRALEEGAKGGG
jgi:hypothetical protein